MRIALGSDHAGFPLKAALVEYLEGAGHDVDDLGTENATVSVDYPDYGAAVGRAAVSGSVDFGIAICGTGIGISMAANKVPGPRRDNGDLGQTTQPRQRALFWSESDRVADGH